MNDAAGYSGRMVASSAFTVSASFFSAVFRSVQTVIKSGAQLPTKREIQKVIVILSDNCNCFALYIALIIYADETTTNKIIERVCK